MPTGSAKLVVADGSAGVFFAPPQEVASRMKDAKR
jgi:hypothetical protein